MEKVLNENLPIELDVRLTQDKKVVVFHDSNLQRMTGVQKNVKDVTLKEIKEIKVRQTSLTILTIDEVLELVDGKVNLLIEIKNNGNVGVIEQILMEKLKVYSGYFAIQSFNPFSCYWIKRNYPKVIVRQLSSDFQDTDMLPYKKFVLKNMLFNFIVKPDFISYDINALPSKIVQRIRENGIPELSWTIKEKEQPEKAKIYSDNFIFEGLIDVG